MGSAGLGGDGRKVDSPGTWKAGPGRGSNPTLGLPKDALWN